MFKNRHFEVKFVKDNKEESFNDQRSEPTIDLEEISRIAQDLGKKAVVGAIVVIGSAIALNTLSRIAVNACDNTNEKEED